MGIQHWWRDEDRCGPIDDETLARYAWGRLIPSRHAAVALHLANAPRDRTYVDLLEALAGSELERAAPVPPADARAMLVAILAHCPERHR